MRRAMMVAAGIAIAAGATAAEQPLFSRQIVETAMKEAECDVEVPEAVRDQHIVSIDRRYKLVQVPCTRGAYNVASVFLVVDTRNRNAARRLEFKMWDGSRFIPWPTLTNAAYDEKTRILGGFDKGRGVGDCGTASEWRWDGATFRLTGFWRKDACDGKAFDFANDNSKWRVLPPR